MEHNDRKFEAPKSPEHRDAYLALVQHCTDLINKHTPKPEAGEKSRDLYLTSDAAEIVIEMILGEYEILTSITRHATKNDEARAPTTFYSQTQDGIWRKREYQSQEEVNEESRSHEGVFLDQVPGTFEEVYGPAIDPPEAYELVGELLGGQVLA